MFRMAAEVQSRIKYANLNNLGCPPCLFYVYWAFGSVQRSFPRYFWWLNQVFHCWHQIIEDILALAWVVGMTVAALILELFPRSLCTTRNAQLVQRCNFGLIGSFIPAMDEQYRQCLSIPILCQLSLGLCSTFQLLINSSLSYKRRSNLWIYIIATGSVILWGNAAGE